MGKITGLTEEEAAEGAAQAEAIRAEQGSDDDDDVSRVVCVWGGWRGMGCAERGWGVWRGVDGVCCMC
jgi:hypothetical protein